MARPTKLTDKAMEKAREYIAECVDYYDEGAKTWRVNLPKAEGLARKLGVHRDTLYTWAKQNQEFSDILEAVNQEQAERLINNSLSGTYNPTIAKLVLGKHGYKESSETDITTGGEKLTYNDEQITKIANRVREGSDGETRGE